MAELRVKSTGTLKLFENDNTSSVTIASPASLGADRTITLPDGDVTLATGTMPVLTGSTNNQVTTVTAANAIQGENNQHHGQNKRECILSRCPGGAAPYLQCQPGGQ